MVTWCYLECAQILFVCLMIHSREGSYSDVWRTGRNLLQMCQLNCVYIYEWYIYHNCRLYRVLPLPACHRITCFLSSFDIYMYSCSYSCFVPLWETVGPHPSTLWWTIKLRKHLLGFTWVNNKQTGRLCAVSQTSYNINLPKFFFLKF